MTASDKLFAGAIPDTYARFLVPLLFEFYGQDLAARAAEFELKDVLEAAAGTGALTRALVARLPMSARIIATDLNQTMLDRASREPAGDGRVVWRQADALALPFDDQEFDAVLCQFGVMFYPDKVRGFGEARRVLRPGGRFLFNVWERISENEFASAVHDALAGLFGPGAPDFLARTPYGYHDVPKIEKELAAAGFISVSIEALEGVSRASSPREVAVAFCQGTPMRNEIEVRFPGRLDEATEFAAEALARRFGTGQVEGRMKAFVITAGP